MTYRLLLIIFLSTATSCQFFETEKVSSEEIFNDEIKAIDWNDVDRYPTFPNCEDILDKAEQKDCFIHTVTSQLYQSINRENMVAAREIYDTVKVDFEINSSGQLSIIEIKIDTLLQKEFPDLKKWLLNSIDSLHPVAPAYKRGIPVKTKFTLPVIIQTP